jgi:hypothetical protein
MTLLKAGGGTGALRLNLPKTKLPQIPEAML